MTTQANKHTDVARRNHAHRRGGALMAAAGAAIAVLLLAGPATGADNMPATQPTTAPSMTDAATPTTAPSAMSVMNMPTTAPSMGASADAAAAPATQPAASLIASGLDKDGNLNLLPGRTAVIVGANALKRISVGQPDVADVKAISPTTVLLTAKKAGSTELIIWDDNEHMQKVEVTVEVDLQVVREQLKTMFPGSHIEASAMGDSIALHGHVPSMQVAEQVVELTGAYTKAVHNFLDVYGGQQVMLQVRFAEISKGAIRNLGINFGGTDLVSSFTTTAFGGGTNVFNLGGPAASAFTSTVGTSTALFGSGRFGHTPFDYFIAALRENNLIRVLAEPNVLATSGQQASFLAGGEIPVPVPQPGNGGNTITIEYKQFGVQLNFIPQVLGNGKIRLKVAPEVSQLDYSTAVSVAGTTVPGFTDRKLDTTVELEEGQTLALAGLLNNSMNATVQEIPVLGQIPVLGALFRSTAYQRNETELVIVVTPRLVGAMNPDQVTPLPGEHWRFPNDAQIYGFADLGGPAGSRRAGPPPQYHGTYGFSAAGAGGAMPQP